MVRDYLQKHTHQTAQNAILGTQRLRGEINAVNQKMETTAANINILDKKTKDLRLDVNEGARTVEQIVSNVNTSAENINNLDQRTEDLRMYIDVGYNIVEHVNRNTHLIANRTANLESQISAIEQRLNPTDFPLTATVYNHRFANALVKLNDPFS